MGSDGLKQNLFKSVLDGLLYVILYIAIPTVQCISYLLSSSDAFWTCFCLMTASLAYDSYTRFDKKNCSSKKNKIWQIGFVSLLLSVISLGLIFAGVREVHPAICFVCLFLLVPFVYASSDIFKLILINE